MSQAEFNYQYYFNYGHLLYFYSPIFYFVVLIMSYVTYYINIEFECEICTWVSREKVVSQETT